MLKDMATLVALLAIALPAFLAAKDPTAKSPLESGFKVGERIPRFTVEDITGPNRGRAVCYV